MTDFTPEAENRIVLHQMRGRLSVMTRRIDELIQRLNTISSNMELFPPRPTPPTAE